ncbi:MAG TPA: potassium channel protein [Flavobacteriales bacterium]|jgi:voltage-gated potassium channel|nr:potassium channel protein [Flavobacteriales bacterium]
MLFNLKFFKEIYYALATLLAIIFIGTLGFKLIEGYNVFEAFYMTIITVSTVGFSEVRPLSDMGRLFTAFLIITSFGIFAYAVSSITRYLVTGKYKNYFKDYRVNKAILNMKDHVIVCGYGRNGKQAVATLQAHKVPFIVIEQNEAVVEDIRLHSDLIYMRSNATSEEVLIDAGIERARAMITTLPEDADNVFVVLTARSLNADLNIISRASELQTEKKLKMAGANNVIMPDRVGGSHMASLVVTPDVMEFLDKISITGSADINLEEVEFKNIPASFRYKSFQELENQYQIGAKIIGYKTAAGEYIINPPEDLEFIPNSKLFVLGNAEQIRKLNSILIEVSN